MRYLRQQHNLTQVSGPHWTDWYIGDVNIANVCDSPHPGPYYGSSRWVDRELTTNVEVVVRRSRPVNATECHIINERLDYERQYGRPQPPNQRIRLIPEVEATYDNIRQNVGDEYRVDIGSFYIYWNECVVLD